jgi:hypothetical protein
MNGKKRDIQWPSLFLFLLGIISIITFGVEQKMSLLLQALGFFCLGYASISFVAGDLFTQKLSFSTLMKVNAEASQLDVLLQVFGFLLLLTSLVFGLVLGI